MRGHTARSDEKVMQKIKNCHGSLFALCLSCVRYEEKDPGIAGKSVMDSPNFQRSPSLYTRKRKKKKTGTQMAPFEGFNEVLNFRFSSVMAGKVVRTEILWVRRI